MNESEWRRLPKKERRALKVANAKKMRDEPRPAEKRLLEIVCERLPHGGWCAQKMVCGFIADVASRRFRIVLEADGSAHDGRESYDAKRDQIMAESGWTVLRFWNHVVLMGDGRVVYDAIMASDVGEKVRAEAARRERKRVKNQRKRDRKLARISAAFDAARDYDRAAAQHVRAIMAGG